MSYFCNLFFSIQWFLKWGHTFFLNALLIRRCSLSTVLESCISQHYSKYLLKKNVLLVRHTLHNITCHKVGCTPCGFPVIMFGLFNSLSHQHYSYSLKTINTKSLTWENWNYVLLLCFQSITRRTIHHILTSDFTLTWLAAVPCSLASIFGRGKVLHYFVTDLIFNNTCQSMTRAFFLLRLHEF